MASAGDQVENPLTGERIVFRLTSSDTAGELLELDSFWTRSGHRTPAHVHPDMEERWKVISGSACFRIGGVERVAGPGETVIAPPGTPHEAWNAGEAPVHVRIQMRPALRWEEFVERLFGLASAPGAAERGGPDPESLQALLLEFRREVAPPPPGG